MTDDLVKQLRDRDAYAKTYGWDNVIFGKAADEIEHLQSIINDDRLEGAADEILRLRKQIAVMKVEKSLADACLPAEYVRQIVKTGTGDFAKDNMFDAALDT